MASRGITPSGSPLVVAHRAGNDLALLRAAEEAGAALVEADVQLFRGRLEVRHMRTLGPVPVLWDRWALGNPFAPRLTLAALLEAARPDTELLLDLKGRDPRLTTALVSELDRRPRRRVAVCSRSWHLLDPLLDRRETRVLHSIGSRRELGAFLHRFAGRTVGGVSVRESLLDARTHARLRSLAAVVVAWTVNCPRRADELRALGVDALTTDELDRVGGLAAPPPRPATGAFALEAAA